MGENLKEELENVTVQLEELRRKKSERMNRFKEVIDELLSLSFQLGDSTDYLKMLGAEEADLSLHKLEELRRQLAQLQNEKVCSFLLTLVYPDVQVSLQLLFL